MQTLDADLDPLAIDVEQHLALAHDRVLELADLVALRQVRVEIVLSVEHRALVDLGLEPQARADGLANAFLVDHRQHAGHGRIHEAHIGIGRIAEGRRRAGKQLAFAGHLRVHFHADDHFPVAGRTGNQALLVGGAGINEGHWAVLKDKANLAICLAVLPQRCNSHDPPFSLVPEAGPKGRMKDLNRRRFRRHTASGAFPDARSRTGHGHRDRRA
jgi:hypothetical protein